MSFWSARYYGARYFSSRFYGAHLEELRENVPALMQAVIVPGDRTTEGILVQAVTVSFVEILHEVFLEKLSLHDIHWRKLEEIIAASYKKAGFDEVTLTPASGDYGRDVIAIKHGFGAVRIIEQVKGFSPGNLVTATDVRAIIGVLAADHNATKAVVTTTTDFAPRIRDDPSIKPFIPFRLELIDGNQLRERLINLLPNKEKTV
jgi:restriction system protein